MGKISSYEENGNSDNDWEQQDLIRTEMRNYLNNLLITLSFLKQSFQKFFKQYSPQFMDRNILKKRNDELIFE